MAEAILFAAPLYFNIGSIFFFFFVCSNYARWTVWPMSSVAYLRLFKYVSSLSSIYPRLCRPSEVALVQHVHIVYVRVGYGK